MPPVRPRLVPLIFTAVLAASALLLAPLSLRAETDLDALMKQVLARRDENWKKLQQYILEEREHTDVRGPAGIGLWGQDRQYIWYMRDDRFVRSPTRVDGVAVSDADRRKYEDEYLKREQGRDARRDQRRARQAETDAGANTVIDQVRQPGFVSSAYFLRFRFEEGKYALVGREQMGGVETLRIEYYPSRLFSKDPARRSTRREDDQYDRLFDKVSLITLWVEPKSHQIVKYTFDNVGMDFLPGQWLVRVSAAQASMTMGRPFPDVWLPARIDVKVGLTLATGPIDVRESIEYHDYKLADVTAKVKIGGDQ